MPYIKIPVHPETGHFSGIYRPSLENVLLSGFASIQSTDYVAWPLGLGKSDGTKWTRWRRMHVGNMIVPVIGWYDTSGNYLYKCSMGHMHSLLGNLSPNAHPPPAPTTGGTPS